MLCYLRPHGSYFTFSSLLHVTSGVEAQSSAKFWTLLKVRKNQKADWRVLDSPKIQTDEFDMFAVKSKKANKTKSSTRQSAFEIN